MDSRSCHRRASPLLSFTSFVHHHCLRIGAELASRLGDAQRLAGLFPATPVRRRFPPAPFASLTHEVHQDKSLDGVAMGSDEVAKALAGTAVYTVSNSNNEFVLISDPNGVKSISLLCFRQEDAESFLAQVLSRKRELRSGAKVVPVSLDEVYMLKVEGIAFRFMPDPVQIKNAHELKPAITNAGFFGVPVFQSDLLILKRKNKRYCPIYFQKEDIEAELSRVSRASRGQGVCQHILVGSLEDVLRKMEMSEKNSGWEDLIFIPPGKNFSQHVQEVAKR